MSEHAVTVGHGAPRGPVVVAAASGLEYRAARRAMRREVVWRVGVGLARLSPRSIPELTLLVGLAGSLESDLAAGSIFIPTEVGLDTGSRFPCHGSLTQALREAAREVSGEVSGDVATGTLLTSRTIIERGQHAGWAGQGYRAVDMEMGRLAAEGAGVAGVRVILDSPGRPLSGAWVVPASAAIRPSLWPELIWLVRHAPGYCRLAAHVAARGLALWRGEA